MRQQTVLLACLCSAIALVSSVPVPASNQELDVLQIPLSNNKELDVLTLGTAEQLADRNKRTIGILRDLFPDITKNGDVSSIDLEALNKQLEETIRVARQATEAEGVEAEQKLTQTNEVQASSSSSSTNLDQQTAESKSPAIDELNLDSNEDTADVDDRNKRFLTLGASNAADGNSKGNSGNFLFDIVRLFSGSTQTQTGDEAANTPTSSSSSSTAEGDISADSEGQRTTDGYSEGIPGPVTRLVVLANRGLANLIQDLILRIAATSERLVNFKARLITALI